MLERIFLALCEPMVVAAEEALATSAHCAGTQTAVSGPIKDKAVTLPAERSPVDPS